MLGRHDVVLAAESRRARQVAADHLPATLWGREVADTTKARPLFRPALSNYFKIRRSLVRVRQPETQSRGGRSRIQQPKAWLGNLPVEQVRQDLPLCLHIFL